MEREERDPFLEESYIHAPAPWKLQGDGYICVLRCPQEVLKDQSFIQPSLSNKLQFNFPSLMIFVNYQHSPVGPYHELLFIPGRFNLGEKSKYLSISRIFVSSMDSVVNGRRNWGIPKEVAEFNVSYDRDKNLDRVVVKRNGNIFAELEFRSYAFPIPFTTALFPKSWHSLAQRENSRDYIFCPNAKGWLRPARLVEARIDATEFPPIEKHDVRMVFKITEFEMYFPEAKISETKVSK